MRENALTQRMNATIAASPCISVASESSVLSVPGFRFNERGRLIRTRNRDADPMHRSEAGEFVHARQWPAFTFPPLCRNDAISWVCSTNFSGTNLRFPAIPPHLSRLAFKRRGSRWRREVWVQSLRRSAFNPILGCPVSSRSCWAICFSVRQPNASGLDDTIHPASFGCPARMSPEVLQKAGPKFRSRD